MTSDILAAHSTGLSAYEALVDIETGMGGHLPFPPTSQAASLKDIQLVIVCHFPDFILMWLYIMFGILAFALNGKPGGLANPCLSYLWYFVNR
mgnify:CR=1 FL=1